MGTPSNELGSGRAVSAMTTAKAKDARRSDLENISDSGYNSCERVCVGERSK